MRPCLPSAGQLPQFGCHSAKMMPRRERATGALMCRDELTIPWRRRQPCHGFCHCLEWLLERSGNGGGRTDSYRQPAQSLISPFQTWWIDAIMPNFHGSLFANYTLDVLTFLIIIIYLNLWCTLCSVGLPCQLGTVPPGFPAVYLADDEKHLARMSM